MSPLRVLLVKTLAVHAALGRVLTRFGRRVRRRDLLLASLLIALGGYAVDLLGRVRRGPRRAAAVDAGLTLLVLTLGRRALPGLRVGWPAMLAGAAAVALEELCFYPLGDRRHRREPVPARTLPGSNGPPR